MPFSVTSNMPTEDSPSRPGPTMRVVLHPGDTNSVRIVRQDVTIQSGEMMEIMLDDFQSQSVVSGRVSYPSAEDVNLQGSPEPQLVDREEATATSQEPIGPLDLPCHEDHPASEEAAIVGLRHETAKEEPGTETAHLNRPRLTRTWIAALSVGTLLLIVVPGVVLGVLIKEPAVGIGLSAGIATVIGIFAGFYYNYRGRG